jgi:hypothetical protein
VRCKSLQTFQQERGSHENSTDHDWPGPGKTDKQRDGKITEEVVNLPTQRRAGCPVGRTQRTDHEQDYEDPATNFCSNPKTRCHIDTHGNTVLQSVPKQAHCRIDTNDLRSYLIATAMDLAMVAAAERDGEFIADLPAKRSTNCRLLFAVTR